MKKKKKDKQTKTCCKPETVAQVYVASTQKAEATLCYSVSGYEEESEKKQGSEDGKQRREERDCQ